MHYAGVENNGANYSWCAATAGSCVDSGTAVSSVCPKGWQLPTKTQYDTLKNKGYKKVDSNTGDNVFDGYNIAGGFFPAAGYVYDGAL